MDIETQRILITGATGFIGRHLVDRAIADSAAIRATAEAHRVFYTTTLAAAEAVCMALKQEGDQAVRRLQDLHRSIQA